MNQNLLENIINNIKRLESDHVLDNASIFLFGMNTPGDRIIAYLGARGFKVEGVLDNNAAYNGRTLFGVSVSPPDIIRDYIKKDPDGKAVHKIRVLIASRYYREMCAQLEKMGLCEGTDIIKLIDFESGIEVSDSAEAFEQAAARLRQCGEVYRSIIDVYGADAYFLLCPIRANGDMYIAASLMKSLRKKYGTDKLFLVTVGGLGKKIALMFGETDVICVTQEEMDSLSHFAGVMGSRGSRMHMFYPKAFPYGIFANMECYKGLNYMDLTACGMLGLDRASGLDKEACKSVTLPADQGRVDNTAVRDEIQDESTGFTGRDILLAPYANSLPCFLPEFWERLARKLTQAGYNVYTNSCGDTEPAVAGTGSVFLPIGDMPRLLSRSAGFIAIRNGLCDIVARAKCRKIILYPDKAMGFGSVRDFYGLNAMGLCDDAVELIYSEQCADGIIDTIMGCLESGT